MSKMYKILIDGKSAHGGNLVWDLPGSGKPGEWHRVNGKISVCTNGLHLTTQPYDWYKWGADVYEAEGRGKSDMVGNKTAFREARLLNLVEEPEWLKQAKKFIDTIKNVKWFCNGKLPKSKKIRIFETRDAARKAAQDAARDAVRDAAGGAAWGAARDAAWDAAWDAAGGAARDAAWDAARDAARKAAWDAAGDAARDAVRKAARDAARKAAWDAAGDAARDAQCLIAELKGKHLAHAELRWSVWAAGYGVCCDVDGVLYCYQKS